MNKNNLKARTRLISEEKLNREMAMRRFERANSKKPVAYSLVLFALVAITLIAVKCSSAESHNNSQVSLHNYCMEYDCLITPEAVKFLENEGRGNVLTDEDIE